MTEKTSTRALPARPSRRKPPARPVDVRRHNLALVLQQVAARVTVSRAELAGLTRLTKGTVSTLVNQLLDLGLLVELGTRLDGRVGRPRRVLALNGSGHCAVGLEINVDYVAVCVTNLLHEVRFHRVEAVDNRGRGPQPVLDRTGRLLRAALEAAEAQRLSPAAVAVAVPGTVDVAEGRLLVAPNLGWSDLPIVDELVARLDRFELPVLADNEANLAALGELWLGIGGDCGDFIHVSGEIGIGAGIVVGGDLFRGSRGFAGEIGHVVIDPHGPECSCGGRGCLERFAGQEAVLRSAGLGTTTATRLGGLEHPFRELIGMLEAEEPRAVASVRDAAAALGVALADMVNLLDPNTIVLGGAYASLAPWLVGPLAEAIAQQVIASVWRPVAIRPSALGPDAAVRGAAASVVQQVLASPGVPVAASA